MKKQLTKQEAFDKAAIGVIKQGAPSIAATERRLTTLCRYLSDDGLCCGVGHLLPSDDMRKKWDERAIYMQDYEADGKAHSFATITGFKDDLIKAGLINLTPKFLAALQAAHDDASLVSKDYFIDQFKYNMRNVARRFRVSPKVLDKC